MTIPAPRFIAPLLQSPALALLARIALTCAYWWGGAAKAFDFASARAETTHFFGSEHATLLALATIVVELVASALVISGRLAWLVRGRAGRLHGAGHAGRPRLLERKRPDGALPGVQRVPRAHRPDRRPRAGGGAGRATSRGDDATTSDSRWPALLLAFIGGYVDTFSFVVLAGLFTAHVTGNFVLIGAAVAGHGDVGVLAKLLALPVFVLAVAVAHALHRRRESRGLASARVLVLLQLAWLFAFLALGMGFGPFADVDAPLAG